VHRISGDLRPSILDFGLVAAIDWQAKEFEKQLGITCEFAANRKDIIVLRTFSKIYGMAGIRAGLAVGHPDTLKKLEGKMVRIPGFVVPLDDFQEEGAEFLLVPYYGACVHTPPPPPNQIVMVGMTGRKSIKLGLFDAVWLSGRLKIASVESPYGTVGYQLEGMKVEPYSSK